MATQFSSASPCRSRGGKITPAAFASDSSTCWIPHHVGRAGLSMGLPRRAYRLIGDRNDRVAGYSPPVSPPDRDDAEASGTCRSGGPVGFWSSTHRLITTSPAVAIRPALKVGSRTSAKTRVRYGYRRVHVMLTREGWDINGASLIENIKDLHGHNLMGHRVLFHAEALRKHADRGIFGLLATSGSLGELCRIPDEQCPERTRALGRLGKETRWGGISVAQNTWRREPMISSRIESRSRLGGLFAGHAA